MKSPVDKIIFECVDTALSQFRFINKQAFYRLFEDSYGITRENIGSNYETFHLALKSITGIRHLQVESKIVQIMKERTKQGIYSQIDEIEAFSIIADSYMNESERQVEKVRKITSMHKYTQKLRQQVKEADEKMKSAERMVAVGETAAMVGHDIRNPLQALIGDLYLASEELKELPDGEHKRAIQESFDSMRENISYIDKIVVDLQDYARPLTPDYDVVNLSDIINGVVITFNIPENIKLKLSVKNNLSVRTDSAFIRRILTNLVNNAIQAMPNGGALELAASRVENKICLMICDNGEGIPEEVRQRMFKPLVATKSKGQGLGLAVVKRLVDSLGGKITFESEKDKGTEFFIELPVQGF